MARTSKPKTKKAAARGSKGGGASATDFSWGPSKTTAESPASIMGHVTDAGPVTKHRDEHSQSLADLAAAAWDFITGNRGGRF